MATRASVQPATTLHVSELAKRMRVEDVEECRASMDLDPLNALIASDLGLQTMR